VTGMKGVVVFYYMLARINKLQL